MRLDSRAAGYVLNTYSDALKTGMERKMHQIVTRPEYFAFKTLPAYHRVYQLRYTRRRPVHDGQIYLLLNANDRVVLVLDSEHSTKLVKKPYPSFSLNDAKYTGNQNFLSCLNRYGLELLRFP